MSDTVKFEPKDKFTFNKKTYLILVHAAIIGDLGVRTSAEIAADDDAQKFLVENKCTGVIEDVTPLKKADPPSPPAGSTKQTDPPAPPAPPAGSTKQTDPPAQ